MGLMLFLMLFRASCWPHFEIVERGNEVIGVFDDGYICYGQKRPPQAACKRSVPSPADTLIVQKVD